MSTSPDISNRNASRRTWLRRSILFIPAIGICIGAEVAGYRSVNPTGRVHTLRDYLLWKPAADRFAVGDMNGRTFVIAYGPMSSWLFLSSGPSAYAFDETGQLVDWSSDVGDDPAFDQKWNGQHFAGPYQQKPRSAIEALAATQPAG